MVPKNSHVPFMGKLFTALIRDIALGRPSFTAVSLQRDLQTILSRIDSEGTSFGTRTLPTLRKAVLQSFRTGKLETPLGFAKLKGTTLPRFLSGLLKDVYTNDGQLRHDASVPAIAETLQITGLCHKLDLPFTKGEDDMVIQKFIETERALACMPPINPDDPIIEFARTMVTRIFESYDPENVSPRHGPGSVATGEVGRQKWKFSRFYPRLDSVFPYSRYFFLGSKHLTDQVGLFTGFEYSSEPVTKVILVPKDSRGPRLISEEPLEIQYIQQGIFRQMVSILERDRKSVV